LGRFDLCNIAGLIPTELAPSLLFTAIQSQFSESTMHLDVILNKDYPITLSMNHIPGYVDATELQLGVTNLQISVKDLHPHRDADGNVIANVYDDPANQQEVVRVRLDGVISLQLLYFKERREFQIYIPGFAEQNVHLSVPAGHGGASYDDVNVINDILDGILSPLLNKMAKSLSDGDPTIRLVLKGDKDNDSKLSVPDVMDFDFTLNAEAAENGTCGDNVATYFEDDGTGKPTNNLRLKQTKKQKNKTNQKSSTAQAVHVGANFNPSTLGTGHFEEAPADLFNACEFLYPGNKVVDGVMTHEDNPIRDALCDFGIKDLTVDPTIIFDNDTGYLHISADMALKLEKWIKQY